MTRLSVALCVGALTLPFAAGAQRPERPTRPEDLPRVRKLAALLKREVDVSEISGKTVTARTLLMKVSDSLTKLNKGKEVLILVDINGFRAATDEELDADKLLGKKMKMPASAKRMTANKALALAISAFPVKGGFYLLRRDYIEISRRITTDAPSFDHPITITKRPLADAMKKVSETTAILIRVDKRVGDKARTPVTATIKPDADLLPPLRGMAEKAGLAVLVHGGEVLVTTPAHAAELQKKRDKQ
jgi:hypothetical protein